MVPSSFAVPNSKVSGFGDLEPFAAMSVSLPATLAAFAGAAPSLAPSSWLSVSFVHKGGRAASLLVALCGLVDPRAQAAAAAIVFVFSVDALKGALIMLLEDRVSGAVAGLQFLSSWSVVETNDERCSWAAGSGEFVGIMALLGCCSCAVLNNLGDLALKNFVPVELFMSVAALGCDYCKIVCFEAAAAAAAFVLGLAHTFQAEPAACAQVGFYKIFQSHAAAARAAAVDALHSVEQFLGCVFETFWWMLAFVWYDVGSHMLWILLRISGKEDWTFPGLWKDQKDSMVEEKAEGSPIPQASIPEAVVVNDDSMCFDGHVQFKGKDRHDIDGSLSLGLGQATGRVDVPVGVTLNAEELYRSGQSVALVSPGSCVVKTIFVKEVDGNTVVHRVHEHTVVGDLLDCTMDVWVTYNGKLVQPGDTIGHIGIGSDDTLRCHGRPRGGAQRYRSQPVDIPGQWTCQACGQERVWPVKTRCFRCGCPKGHVPLQPEPFPVGPLGRAPQRTAPTNPTFRPPRQNPKPVPPKGATNFPPLNQPSSVGQADASASGTVPAFPAGSLDWLVAFLRQIMSPEDFEKYKSSFDPTPAKEEEPLAVQLANKTKEMGTVMRQIEHYRNVCRDLEVKLMRQGELLDENIARKAALQDEINVVEARIAAEETGPPPAAPPGPPPELQEAFPPPPEEEMDEDTQMENEAPDTGGGVGSFALPSKKRVVKSAFRKRASLRLTESRSSVFTKLSKLSPPELLRLSEHGSCEKS